MVSGRAVPGIDRRAGAGCQCRQGRNAAGPRQQLLGRTDSNARATASMLSMTNVDELIQSRGRTLRSRVPGPRMSDAIRILVREAGLQSEYLQEERIAFCGHSACYESWK